MRQLRLAQIAMEAETSRLSQQLRRLLSRIAAGLVALFLLLAGLGFVHAAAWIWLRQAFSPLQTAGLFAAADLILAFGMAMLALRSSPGRVEREALAVRRQAVAGIEQSLALPALLSRLTALLIATYRKL